MSRSLQFLYERQPGKSFAVFVARRTSQNNISKTMATDSCPLLDLAAELRNRIYEYVFAHDEEKEVDLLHATPPSSALLRTCRQIYSEANQVYKHAFREFWTSSRFVASFALPVNDHPYAGRAAVMVLRAADINAIRHLRLVIDERARSQCIGKYDYLTEYCEKSHMELLPNSDLWICATRECGEDWNYGVAAMRYHESIGYFYDESWRLVHSREAALELAKQWKSKALRPGEVAVSVPIKRQLLTLLTDCDEK